MIGLNHVRTELMHIGHDAIIKASAIVRAGGIVAFPTDTVYGLGCNPFDGEAVERLFAVKHREGKPISVLCASMEDAKKLVEFGPVANKLAKAHWPGALTIVARLREKMPERLHNGTGMLGVRIPAREDCLELARECGGFITGTSANPSGEPSCTSAKDVMARLGGSIDLVLDGGKAEIAESTVVKIVGNEIDVLRSGGVKLENELIPRAEEM